MKAHVYVTLKTSVLDPQGQTIQNALRKIGFAEVTSVRQGKYFALSLADGLTAEAARAHVERIAAEVLTNPVIEEYTYRIEEQRGAFLRNAALRSFSQSCSVSGFSRSDSPLVSSLPVAARSASPKAMCFAETVLWCSWQELRTSYDDPEYLRNKGLLYLRKFKEK